jgi:myo-inositol 2-dehydrogenase/D-chiro-inositol 1-dehydrogenase
VRVGVIGVGGMGAFHARTLASLAGVDVVAVADPYRPNVDALVADLGCDGSVDPLALASSDRVDAVVIASPDETHPDLAVAALGAGHWVLCEKPLATSLDDARRVVDAEVAVGHRRIQMGFMREYDPAHTQLRDALLTMGRLDGWRSVHRNVNAAPRPVERIVCQSMVHDFHSVHFLTGERIEAVQCFAGRPIGDSFRHVVAMCRTSSGIQAVVEFDDCGFAYEVLVDVTGEHGDATTGAPLRAVLRRNGAVETVIGPDWFAYFADAYRIQDAAWIASIRSGRAVGPSVWDGFVAQAVVDAAMASYERGTTVDVQQFETPAIYA